MIESSSSMNILFFSRLFYPHIGGVEKHVMEISKVLIKRGYKITVVTEQDFFEEKLSEIFEGIQIFRIPKFKNGKNKKFKIWKWLWNNRQLIKDADIIHCHDVFFWYLPFRLLFPLKKVFTTFHGYEGNSLPSRSAIIMHKLAEKLSMGNICVGDYLSKWYGTRPTRVTYGAIDSKSSVRIIENKNPNRNGIIKVTFVGRLEKEAGIIEYLEVLKTLRDRRYKIKLIVLGDGLQRLQAEKFCKIHKLDVEFKGFVRNVDEYLINSDYVFTSRFLSTLEALNNRKFAFVIYNNAIKKDCFAMSPFVDFISLDKDVASLSSRFIYYLNHKELVDKEIINGYNWVKKQTWEALVNLYLTVWRIK